MRGIFSALLYSRANSVYELIFFELLESFFTAEKEIHQYAPTVHALEVGGVEVCLNLLAFGQHFSKRAVEGEVCLYH